LKLRSALAKAVNGAYLSSWPGDCLVDGWVGCWSSWSGVELLFELVGFWVDAFAAVLLLLLQEPTRPVRRVSRHHGNLASSPPFQTIHSSRLPRLEGLHRARNAIA
jgi:hypothetical protein